MVEHITIDPEAGFFFGEKKLKQVHINVTGVLTPLEVQADPGVPEPTGELNGCGKDGSGEKAASLIGNEFCFLLNLFGFI